MRATGLIRTRFWPVLYVRMILWIIRYGEVREVPTKPQVHFALSSNQNLSLL